MDELETTISRMDYRFFGTGQHKIDAETFLKRKDAIFVDMRAKEECETLKIQLKHHLPVLEIPLCVFRSNLPPIPTKLPLIPIQSCHPPSELCDAGIFVYLK